MKKKRKTFDINKWRQNKQKAYAEKQKVFKLIAGHPLTWLVIMIAIVYIHDAWVN